MDQGRNRLVQSREAWNEDRTPWRTHIFLSVAHLNTDHHTHLRVAQVWDVLHLCAFYTSFTHIIFHRPLFDVLTPFPSFLFHATSIDTELTAAYNPLAPLRQRDAV